MYKVTVGICCFRQKKWLYRCLRSLANQTMKKNDFEVIIVNDDPEQDLEEICFKLQDVLNIRLLQNKKNEGLPRSLNKILRNSRGRYFTRVDSDDYVSRHYLEYMTIFLENNRNYQAVNCDYKYVNEIGTVINQHVSQNENTIACATMFTYESLCEINFYNEEFKMREGHELLERYIKKFKLFNIPLPFYRYRIHESNRTKNKKDTDKYDKMLENT